MIQFLRHYYRSLSKRKLISIITVGGFAISMAVILLLIVFIAGENNVNKSFPNANNIYRLKRGEETLVPEKILENIQDEVPSVKKICMYSLTNDLFQIGNTKTNVKRLATNDAFMDIFSFDFIYQSTEPTLDIENHVIITQSFSKKWFGDINPIGETILGNSELKIVGVISDPPKNSSLNFDLIVGLKEGWAHFTGSKEDNITHRLFNSFVQIQDNSDPEIAAGQLTVAINKWALFKNDKVTLQPLKEVYFDTATSGDYLPHANIGMMYLLSTIAVIILIMTIFNYVNLTISSGYQRLKEIGIKKATGAANRNIFLQFLFEGVSITFISFIIASIFASLLSPVLSEILGKDIEFDILISIPEIWIVFLIVFSLTGIVSGIFPAIIFSRYSSLHMVSNKLTYGKSTGRGLVVTLQFVIAIVLIISGFFIQKQIEFIKHRDLGFNKEMIVRLKLSGEAEFRSDVLKQELLSNPNILGIAGSRGSIMDFEGTGNNEIEVDGEIKNVDWRMFGIDDSFIDMFGLEIIEGQNLDCSNYEIECLINERYYQYLGWDDFTKEKLFGQLQVVGIVKDFNFDVLHKEIGFLVLEKAFQPDVFNIKITGNIAENLAYIKKCYSAVEPLTEFEYAFYDDWIQGMYEKEEKQAQAFRIFSLFALIISCLGLIGLIETTTIRKIKEIGIRKVNGARVTEIMTMLNKDFLKWVGIAFVFAAPIAYYAMSQWLQNFAYKTSLVWWIFAAAGLLALGIALLTVSWQSYRAASRNPVEALRYE